MSPIPNCSPLSWSSIHHTISIHWTLIWCFCSKLVPSSQIYQSIPKCYWTVWNQCYTAFPTSKASWSSLQSTMSLHESPIIPPLSYGPYVSPKTHKSDKALPNVPHISNSPSYYVPCISNFSVHSSSSTINSISTNTTKFSTTKPYFHYFSNYFVYSSCCQTVH